MATPLVYTAHSYASLDAIAASGQEYKVVHLIRHAQGKDFLPVDHLHLADGALW
jgi:hypothetical protein